MKTYKNSRIAEIKYMDIIQIHGRQSGNTVNIFYVNTLAIRCLKTARLTYSKPKTQETNNLCISPYQAARIQETTTF